MEESKKTVKILLMRHAESTYNVMQSDWKKENGLAPNHPEDEPKRFIVDENIIDAVLTPKGQQQVILLIIVSHFVRALMREKK